MFDYKGNAPLTEEDFYGRKLKLRRKSLGVSQKQLSEATGIDVSTISKYENEIILPSLRNYILMENHFRYIIRERTEKEMRNRGFDTDDIWYEK